MLVLKDLSFVVNIGTKLERDILTKLNMHVKEGEFLIIVGANGAGKSTLFKLISGALSPNSGQIILDGEDITTIKQNHRAKNIASVFQDPKISTIENMTIFENLLFALGRTKERNLLPIRKGYLKQFFQEKLLSLNMALENRLYELVANLSGGQRQALSLIMATICDSKILLLDEITAALDPRSSDNIMKLTDKIVRDKKRTCIMITHNMKHASEYGDRILLLKNGNVFCNNYLL